MDTEPLEPTPLTYQDLEPFLEAQVADPLPEGLVDPNWLREPEIEQDWLREPEIEQDWLREPEIEQDWLQVVEQEPIDASLDAPSLEPGLDLEH